MKNAKNLKLSLLTEQFTCWILLIISKDSNATTTMYSKNLNRIKVLNMIFLTFK